MKSFALLVALVVAGCSDASPSPAESTGGNGTSGSGGALTTAGTTSGGAGMSTGGSASGAGTMSGAGTSGSSMGGSGGAAGAASTAGQGGGTPAAPEAELDGAGWTMTCTQAQDGNLCAVLPPGQGTCPADGYTSIDQTLHFGGTPGTIYDVTIHFQGTHEAGDYTGGTAAPAQFLKGATHTQGGLHTWLSLEVSSPAATYNPNSGASGGSVQIYDYTATIPIEAGATIALKAFDIDCLMHRYCQDNNTSPCKGLVLGDISPANAPIDGAFLHMDVMSVVAK